MIKKLSALMLVIIITNCSNFEFVYDKSIKTNQLTNKTSINITGDNIPILKTELNEILGTSKNINYELNVFSKEETTDIIKALDMTASLIQIKNTTIYELRLLEKNCIIITKKITNSKKFNSKAEGYNFGSDLSRKEIVEELIKENIQQYLSYITKNLLILDC